MTIEERKSIVDDYVQEDKEKEGTLKLLELT